jgi:carbamoyltransferase
VVQTSAGIGRGNELSIERELHFPHSLGLLFSAVTYYTGFKVNSGEYKVMGLAPYGEPVRAPEAALTQFHMDMAASVQKVTEEVMLRLTRSLQAETGASNLCLAGGVALNCVAN